MERIFIILINVLKFLNKQGIGKHDFPVNAFLQTWVAINFNKEIRCSFCDEEGLAVGYCSTCAKLIDEQCVKFHTKIVDLKDHIIIDFRRESRCCTVKQLAPRKYCEQRKHKLLELKYYCTNCSILICQRCLKYHTRKHHYVNSVGHLYDLLDHMHDTKRLSEDILRSSPIRNERDKIMLTTIVTYIDVCLGIQHDYKDIRDVPVPLEIQNLIDREMTNGHEIYLKSEAVIKKVKEIQRDLRLRFKNDCKYDDELDEMSVINDSTDPKQMYNDIREDQLLDDLSNNCSSSSDTTYVTCQDIPDSIPSTGLGPITLVSDSFTTDDLFPSLQQPYDENNATKTIEQEINELRQAPQNQINLDSFNNLHE